MIKSKKKKKKPDKPHTKLTGRENVSKIACVNNINHENVSFIDGCHIIWPNREAKKKKKNRNFAKLYVIRLYSSLSNFMQETRTEFAAKKTYCKISYGLQLQSVIQSFAFFCFLLLTLLQINVNKKVAPKISSVE